MANPVTPMPPASSAMQNLSLQEKIDLFCSLFKGRDDVFARRQTEAAQAVGGEHLGIPTTGFSIIGL